CGHSGDRLAPGVHPGLRDDQGRAGVLDQRDRLLHLPERLPVQRDGLRQRHVVPGAAAAGRGQLQQLPPAPQRYGVLAVAESLITADRALAKPTITATHRRRVTADTVIGLAGRYFLYVFLVVVFLLPFVWMFLGSVRRAAAIF